MAQQIANCLIHWKKKLERGVDEEKALDIIRKLYKVPITIQLLKDTGIGRIIKQLGKQDGLVGEKATIVLKKWKEAVSSESLPDKPTKSSSKLAHGLKEHEDRDKHESASSKHKSHVNGHSVSRTNSSLKSSRSPCNPKEASESEEPDRYSHSKKSHYSNGHTSLSVPITVKSEPTSRHSSKSAHVKRISDSEDSEPSIYSEQNFVNGHDILQTDLISKSSSKSVHTGRETKEWNDSEQHSSSKSKSHHVNKSHKSQTEQLEPPVKKGKHSNDSIKSSKYNSQSLNSDLQNGKKTSKYNLYECSLFDDNSTEAYNPEHPQLFPLSDCNAVYKPTPICSTNGIKKEKSEASYSKSSGSKPISKHSKVEDHLKKGDKHVEKIISTNGIKKEKIEASNSRSSDSKPVSKHIKVEDHSKKEDKHIEKIRKADLSSKKAKYSDPTKSETSREIGEHKAKHLSDNKSKEQVPGSKPHKSKNHESSIKPKSGKRKVALPTTEEFTASQGSFEACLGFNDIVTVKKKKPAVSKVSKTRVDITTSVDVSTKEYKPNKKKQPSTSKYKSSSSSSKSSEATSHSKPESPKIEIPKPSDMKPIDIISTLPEIQPNYKPLPQIDYDRFVPKKKCLSNEEAIMFTSSKRDRTAVYSGRRNYFSTEVPSLFDLCTRILIENVDYLDECGGVPYFLIKPVLERCTPQQLYRLEDYNPYLLEDTNELWERHCLRDFRTYKPEEGETWRDLYLRVFDEKEKKLKALTANISASMSKSNPVRQVKLAYVDSVVKPPRDVARKQAKHGTAMPVNHTVKPSTPSKGSPKSASPAVPISSKPVANPAALKKPKIAPLMAKTLKTLKHVYRR